MSSLLLGMALLSGGCTCDGPGKTTGKAPTESIKVLRVQSASPEQAGGEHCESDGKSCKPLAPGQELPATGLVRTFAGGLVSLDFGEGRRVDLGELSETALDAGRVNLKQGDFSVDSTPLIEQEPPAVGAAQGTKKATKPLTFTALGRELTSDPSRPTTTALSVTPDEAKLTVRRGALTGLDFPGLSSTSPQSGQSARITSAQVFRTAASGGELPSLSRMATRRSDFGELLPESQADTSRGIGSMAARLPNTTQLRDGVKLKRHHVSVVIKDGYARTTVEEEFENSSPHILEGQYRFPVPGDASLSRLALWVGETLMEGEVLERERAAQIYASIVDRPVPRDPALLEWVTGGEMSLKVFPIIPQKTRTVVLAYDQALNTEGDTLRYVYPLSLGDKRENKIDDLVISIQVSDSVAKLSRPRVHGYESEIAQEGSWYSVKMQKTDVTPSQDFVLLMDRAARPEAQISSYVPTREEPIDARFSNIQKDNLLAPPASEGTFALRLSVDLPPEMTRPEPALRKRVYVLDVSQSQSIQTIRAQAALVYGVLSDSDPEESYVLLACDSACQAFRPPLEAASHFSRLASARDWLLELKSGGSSDLAGALTAAATQLRALAPNDVATGQIVFMTDGQASSGELSAETIVKRAGTFLSGLDLRLIGAGRTVDEDTLRALGVKLSATVDLLRSGKSLEERISEISAGLRRPVLRNARVHLPAFLHSQFAHELPALRLGEEVRLTGTIASLEGGQVRLTGSLEGKTYVLARDLKWQTGENSQNPLVPHLWARDRILALQGEELTQENKSEIIRVSTEHQVMSRYTSFLVLESEKMYEDFGVARDKSKSDAAEGETDDLKAKDFDVSFPANKEASFPVEKKSMEEMRTGPPPRDAESLEELSLGDTRSRNEPAPSSAAPPAPVAKSAPAKGEAPRPASAPRASAKPSSGSGRADSMFESDFNPGTSGLGSGSVSSTSPPFEPFDEPQQPRRHMRMRSPIQAHLVFSSADDAWRTWGPENMIALAEALKLAPTSRAAQEAFIRGALGHGRFTEAHEVANAFVTSDPDYAPARELLSYTAALNGDHELSRKMLDVQAEAAPRDPIVHARGSRAFDAVGDDVRACAHFRSLAELAPDLNEAARRAEECWAKVTGQLSPSKTTPEAGNPGQLDAEITCDAGVKPVDCPSPLIVAPDGTVLSPWTPSTGKATRSQVGFVKLRSGQYYVMVVGGSPSAQGKLALRGRHESKTFRFQGGSLHTIAKVDVSFW